MEFSFLNSFLNATILSVKMIFIIIVVMIIYELFEKSKLYNKLQDKLNKPLEKIGFTTSSSITMVVGIILGIAYGAGILIQNATKGTMNSKEIILSCLFLSLCHAVFEDTLIFVAVGGNAFIILGIRIILAFLIIGLLSRFLDENLS